MKTGQLMLRAASDPVIWDRMSPRWRYVVVGGTMLLVGMGLMSTLYRLCRGCRA